MIMADDEKLKHNRLALIKVIRDLISQVADISELSV
jgi:glycyl-tRNA synthetase beta subunit